MSLIILNIFSVIVNILISLKDLGKVFIVLENVKHLIILQYYNSYIKKWINIVKK